MASPWYQSDTSVTSPPMVTVTYTEWNGFEYVVLTAEVEPSYVEYTDLPGRVYTTDHVDRSRALTYYIEFMLGNGNQNVYAVPGGGPYAVALHRGAYARLGETYAHVCGVWAPKSGREFRVEPCLEFYRNDCDTTPEAELVTEVCVPLEP